MKGSLSALVALGLSTAPLVMAPALAQEIPSPTSTTAAPAVVLATPAAAPALSRAGTDGLHVIINEAYVNGGSAGASFKNKFVELYNPTDSAVDLSTWSLQYRSAAGKVPPTGVAALKGSISAKGYYLIKGNSNAENGLELPSVDADASGFSFAAGAGTLVLSDQAAKIPDTLPVGSVVGAANVVDLLGYGTSNTFETAPAKASAVATSMNRTSFADTDNNSADFTISAPTPEGSSGKVPPVDPPVTPPLTPPVDSGEKTIAEVQGTGAASPLVDTVVTTKGVVTAAYPDGGFAGYYIQTPGTGGDVDLAKHTASDAVFIYSPSTVHDVKVGDYVQVKGKVVEFGKGSTTTEINVDAAGFTPLVDPAPQPKATVLTTLPATDTQRETLEGMLVAPEGDYTITNNYSLNNYGEVGLAQGSAALVQPTAAGPVGSAAWTSATDTNKAISIGLDDGASTNFLKSPGSDVALPWLSAGTPMRVGTTAKFTSPVIFDNRNDAYKFQPVETITATSVVKPINFGSNRMATPAAVGGNFKVASFNVQNYFPTTGDKDPKCEFYKDRAGNPVTVKTGCLQRGAANEASFLRQQAKIVSGINASGADVLSLEEIENSAKFGLDRDAALANLVAALNVATPDTWDFVKSPSARPAIGNEDVIRTAFIFKKKVVAPVGDSVILDDAAFTGIARQPLAQSFKLVGAPESSKLLLIVNHFKSKGSAATPDDTDKGQGNSNVARTKQATALLAFSNQQQLKQGTNKVLLMGDFNAYLFEDPITVLTKAGYVDQDTKTNKYSYSYDGMVGSLDHVLASPAALKMVTGADIWNINSPESIAMGYSRYNYNATDFFDNSAFAASDHDPVVVGLDMSTSAVGKEINLLNINDFHGRIDANTLKFAGTIEQLRAASGSSNTAFLSAGDNIGASLFASSSQGDLPTIEVLNALGLEISAVGNHEFDKGWADLDGRVRTAANWDYLGANIYTKGTTTPVLNEYKIVTVNGVKVAVIGALTQETPSLVTPAGIANLTFGDPVEAVNRVAKKIKDQKLADVIVAEYHEGAGDGTVEGATLEQEVAAGGAFADIVQKTSASVNAIFTGHTHKQYVWDAPIPGVAANAAVKTRPILQTGSYGENIGQIQLFVDPTTNSVTSYAARNVPRTTVSDADLLAAFPDPLTKVNGIVQKALADAKVAGSVPVGKISADITTAQLFDPATGKYTRDDRANESALGNLVGDSLLDALKSERTGGAEIGVVNPGGLRADLLYKNPGFDDGVVTYANANAVLPFVNNLWTTSLTGAQVKTMLEQQWQTNKDGSIPSRPFLNLGLSRNVDYTYDSSRALGDHITSVKINGKSLDPKRSYRVGTFSFLTSGGDNFRVLGEGTQARDSGLIDRDAWIKYLSEQSEKAPIAPRFDRRGVDIVGAPATVKEGQDVSVELKKLDLSSLGVTKSSKVAVRYDPSGIGGGVGFSVVTADVLPAELGSAPVADGAATLKFTVPTKLNGGSFTVTTDTGTSARLPIMVPVTAVESPMETPTASPTSPSPTSSATSSATSTSGTTLPPATSSASTSTGGSGTGTDDDLASTGANILPLGLGAIVLLSAGLAFAFAARRKEAKH